jgi:hypothetical protein
LGRLVLIGEVIHRFSGNISGVCSSGGPVTVGDDIVAARLESVFPLVLRSIQNGPASLEFTNLHRGQEIGFGFDRPLNVGFLLYKQPVAEPPIDLPKVDSNFDFQI